MITGPSLFAAEARDQADDQAAERRDRDHPRAEVVVGRRSRRD
jgi:hypothetical protein